MHQVRREVADSDTQRHAQRAADFAQHHPLHDELSHDVAFLGPHGAADAISRVRSVTETSMMS